MRHTRRCLGVPPAPRSRRLHTVLAVVLATAATLLIVHAAHAATPRHLRSLAEEIDSKTLKGLSRVRDAAGSTFAVAGVNAAATDSFQNEVLATGFQLPTAFEFLPDGRMLVAELQGRIKVLPPPYTQPDAGLFLQITNIGSAGVQQGIYDLALDPAFAVNHFYYVFYTLGSPNRDRVARFTANATLSGTVPGSEFVLYEDPQNASAEHHGGSLAFANDGKLLFTTGEHFNASVSPLLTSPRGKVHRINRDGTVPTDNPFYDGSGPNVDTIWARGLRNPFRSYYDAPTGRYYIADVGGNDTANSKEEINLGAAGADYGWPTSEGACSPPCTSPLYSYGHNGRDASITGGFVYHGTQFPTSYQGAYFYADYAQNWIRGLNLDANGAVTGTFNFEPPDGSVDGPYGDIVYLDEGPDGALYYIDLGYDDETGTPGVSKIRRIKYVRSNQAPIAAASATPTSGPAPLTVAFSSSGSSDPEGQPLTYSWAFGDGATSTEANPSHTYSTAGVYQARLTVSDGVNSSLSTPLTISAGRAPTATILSPADGTQFQAGDVIAYSGDGSDPDDGRLPDSAFTWNIDFLHDGHVHPGLAITGVRSGSFTIPTTGHDFSGNTRYRITLTVRDSSGLSSVQSVTIWPRKVNLSFDTVPTGRTIYLDGIAKTAPFTYDTLIGFNHTIEARDQTAGGTSYTFGSWSDGGAQQHTITVPSTPQGYTATFNASQLATGLVGAWSFNEGAGSTVADTSGSGNNWTVTGASRVTGKYGGGLSFNGSSNWVTVPDAASLDLNAFTISVWVKPASTQSGWRTAVMKEAPPSGLAYALYANGVSPSAPAVYAQNPSEVGTGNGPSALPAGQWSYVSGSYDGSALRLYVDGVLKATRNTTGNVVSTSGPLRIGGNGIWGEWFNGALDEVRVYNRALSATEIAADRDTPLQPDIQSPSAPTGLSAVGGIGSVALSWNASTDNVGVSGYDVHRSTTSGFTPSPATLVRSVTGTSMTDTVAPGTYYYRVIARDGAGNSSQPSAQASATATADTTQPSVTVTAPADGSTVSGTVALTATASDNVGVAGVQFRVDGVNVGPEDTTAPYAASWDSTTAAPGQHQITAVARDAASNTKTSAAVSVTINPPPPPSSGLVAAYGFNEGSGSAVADASGSGNAGSISGATWTTGKFGGALSFNGTNNRVNVPDANSLDLNAFTISAWVKPAATQTGWRTLVLKEKPAALAYALYANGVSPAAPALYVENPSEVGTGNGPSALPAGQWTYVTGTYDGSVLRLYVDGVLKASKNTVGTVTASTGALRIGGNSIWNEWFNGALDEIRIYNRALSTTEIANDRTAPVS